MYRFKTMNVRAGQFRLTPGVREALASLIADERNHDPLLHHPDPAQRTYRRIHEAVRLGLIKPDHQAYLGDSLTALGRRMSDFALDASHLSKSGPKPITVSQVFDRLEDDQKQALLANPDPATPLPPDFHSPLLEDLGVICPTVVGARAVYLTQTGIDCVKRWKRSLMVGQDKLHAPFTDEQRVILLDLFKRHPRRSNEKYDGRSLKVLGPAGYNITYNASGGIGLHQNAVDLVGALISGTRRDPVDVLDLFPEADRLWLVNNFTGPWTGKRGLMMRLGWINISGRGVVTITPEGEQVREDALQRSLTAADPQRYDADISNEIDEVLGLTEGGAELEYEPEPEEDETETETETEWDFI